MIKKITIALMTLCAAFCQAQIVQEGEMNQIFNHLEKIDSDTLVLFDVDMVLVQPSDPAFQMANIKQHGAIVKRIMHQIPSEQLMLFLGLMSTKSELILIEEGLPGYVQKLQQKGIPVMAFTANLTGSLGEIRMEEWRIKTLRQLGFDFSHSPFKETLILHDLPPYRGSYSAYQEGILFVNGRVISKGTALLSFLEKIDFSPKKIIFIDDREENLKSVEEALQTLERSIEFLGIHYVGAQNYPSESISEEEFESHWQQLADEAKEIDADKVYILSP